MKKLKFWGVLAIFIIIMMCPQATVTAAQGAMNVWYTSVAPTLFPFLALMPLLTGEEACAAYEAMFSKCMRVLFGLPGAAAPAVVVSMVAGSPGGAIAIRRIAANAGIKPSEARRMAIALAGVSPAYLIMGVGQGLYGSVTLGIKLAAIQICIQLLLLILLPRRQKKDEEIVCRPEEKINENPIFKAVENLLGICGYMVFFSVIAAAAVRLVGERIGGIILLATDLPSGLANLVNAYLPGKRILLGASIGFTGLCIGYQNMDIHKNIGLRWKDYLKGRGMAALLFACACAGMEAAGKEKLQILFENGMKNYTAAFLIAGFMVFPALIFLSRKWFLNK